MKKKYSIDQFHLEYLPEEFYTILGQFLHVTVAADSKVGADTLSVVTKAVWEPEVRPEDLDSPEQQTHAREVLLRSQHRDMHDFHAFLDEAVRRAYEASPSFVKKTYALSEFRSQYVCNDFYILFYTRQ